VSTAPEPTPTRRRPPTTQDEVDRLIEQFDPESNFRRLAGLSAGIVTVIAVALSGWHYYTAGFGLHNEIAHRAIHLSVVLGLCFPGLSAPAPPARALGVDRLHRPGGLLPAAGLGPAARPGRRRAAAGAGRLHGRAAGGGRAVAAAARLRRQPPPHPVARLDLRGLASGFSLYLLLFFDGIFIQRPGQHTPADLMVGVIAIVMVIEATRRTMGIFLPLLAMATVLYGIFGPYLPGGLAHRGYSVPRVIAHLYKGTEGIYGIPVGVVATFVFHFVLFGIMAQLTGPGAAVRQPGHHRRRALCRRAGQGQRGVVGAVRHDQRQRPSPTP
jgi:TRAP-type uncharacterized transport system fused permease subunit